MESAGCRAKGGGRSQPGAVCGEEEVYSVIVSAHACALIFLIIIPIIIGGFRT